MYSLHPLLISLNMCLKHVLNTWSDPWWSQIPILRLLSVSLVLLCDLYTSLWVYYRSLNLFPVPLQSLWMLVWNRALVFNPQINILLTLSLYVSQLLWGRGWYLTLWFSLASTHSVLRASTEQQETFIRGRNNLCSGHLIQICIKRSFSLAFDIISM